MGSIANDKFNTYYQEKIWELIPSIYRHEDGLETNPNPHVLRALVEVMAAQAAILRRSQDRLWEDQFIELCNEWAVPYIGDLVGTRLLSALNKRGRRIDVAKTIYYRRRKGTPRILEELIHDISNWDGKMVEGFTKLVRARHGLDPEPRLFAGRYTGTLPGGVADLRRPFASELADGPFEEFFHTPDMRKPRGLDGRYGITRLNFYLYRLQSYRITAVTPFRVNATRYTFDPSGREILLFARRNRPSTDQWDNWHSALEWELPVPIRCHLLSHAEYEIKEEHIQQLKTDGLLPALADQLKPFVKHRFVTEAALLMIAGFIGPAFFINLLRYSIITDCGKNKLIPSSVSISAAAPVGTVAKELIVAANLSAWTANAPGKQLVIDAEHGRFMFLAPVNRPVNVAADYCYGFPGPFGAGVYDRKEVEDSEPTVIVLPATATVDLSLYNPSEIIEITDNQTYSLLPGALNVVNLVLQAANQQRPYLILSSDIVFDAPGNDATLVLDGLWFGAPGDKQFDIILRGDYECVIIRNCTFDPGGSVNALGEIIHPVSLIIEGVVENMCITHSILGPVEVSGNGMIEEEMVIEDSIVQSTDLLLPALANSTGKTSLFRTTVLGELTVHRLYATDTIITGLATVKDTQTGCFRFSAAPKKVGLNNSRLPGPYESFLFETDNNFWFTSRRFGHPGFAQLSDAVPVEIYRGGENGAEMGVYNSLINAVKADGLRVKVEEYMPFGLIPAFIHET